MTSAHHALLVRQRVAQPAQNIESVLPIHLQGQSVCECLYGGSCVCVCVCACVCVCVCVCVYVCV